MFSKPHSEQEISLCEKSICNLRGFHCAPNDIKLILSRRISIVSAVKVVPDINSSSRQCKYTKSLADRINIIFRGVRNCFVRYFVQYKFIQCEIQMYNIYTWPKDSLYKHSHTKSSVFSGLGDIRLIHHQFVDDKTQVLWVAQILVLYVQARYISKSIFQPVETDPVLAR
ncbi:Hypothetical_protein [Hexamita inflata]|uniref:Hypothetical_protein n=1 Tax=Hexamita inflata TaxID=28002 RepID=A0ABP1HSP2_9EUKA